MGNKLTPEEIAKLMSEDINENNGMLPEGETNTPVAVRTISIGDEDGITEFSDNTILFWTSGRGGFVVEGGLGFWPNSPKAEDNMVSHSEILSSGYGNSNYVESWSELPSDILEKARNAFQSSEPGKYCLSERLREDEDEVENMPVGNVQAENMSILYPDGTVWEGPIVNGVHKKERQIENPGDTDQLLRANTDGHVQVEI